MNKRNEVPNLMEFYFTLFFDIYFYLFGCSGS